MGRGDGFIVCNDKQNHPYVELDCKTVVFFLKISKEIGKAWRKS